MNLEEKLKKLVFLSQERCKFVENPEEFIKNKIEEFKDLLDKERSKMHKRLFETTKRFNNSLALFDKKKINAIKFYTDCLKKDAKKALAPVYVYYKGNKIVVPNSFYSNFNIADTEIFLEYLEEDDRKKNIITDEDRAKARLLNCNLDYVYLQELINKVNTSSDLVVTVKTKDGSIINIHRQEKDVDVEMPNEIIVEPLKVK